MSETTLKNGERPTDEDTASLLRELASIADSCGDHTLRNRALLYSRALAATPPTPDLDAVVARVRRSLDGLADDETFPDGTGYTFGYAADKRGTWVEMTVGDLRALLAAVSRPAEAHWQAYLRETGQHLAAPRRKPVEPSEEMVERVAALIWGTD